MTEEKLISNTDFSMDLEKFVLWDGHHRRCTQKGSAAWARPHAPVWTPASAVSPSSHWPAFRPQGPAFQDDSEMQSFTRSSSQAALCFHLPPALLLSIPSYGARQVFISWICWRMYEFTFLETMDKAALNSHIQVLVGTIPFSWINS